MNYATRHRSSVPETTIHGILLVVLVSALLLLVVYPAQAQTEALLYSFLGAPDGVAPYSRLTADSSGNLYGTTTSGGAGFSGGTVFALSPEPPSGCPSGSNPGSGWCETVLYSFCSVASCADGSDPEFAYVTFDSQGNLYSTTEYGGANGNGTVFELSPEPPSGCPSGSNTGNGWCEAVLYSFAGNSDAQNPVNGLVWDQSGNLYGTSDSGCSNLPPPNNEGCVYQLSPNGGGGWTEQPICGLDTTYAGLAVDASGNLYGTTSGEVFKLSFAGGVWTRTNLHAFTGSSKDGLFPEGTPAVDGVGNIYGTTYEGGSEGYGTVWKLTPVTTGKKKGTYTEKILHDFTSYETGVAPWAGVTLDASGNIYGTTRGGGEYGSWGTVFELAVSGATYKDKLLWSFNIRDGGFYPWVNPILDSSGNLYGTTSGGGADGYGVVYEVTPSGTAATTATTLTSSPNPSTSGETVVFTAVVTPAPFDGETITFEHGKTVLGTGTLSGGSATFGTSALPVGTTTVKAVYGGDGDFDASTSNTVKQVVKE
jgi:uncharacterized repeat protein (TIGR03803 family)